MKKRIHLFFPVLFCLFLSMFIACEQPQLIDIEGSEPFSKLKDTDGVEYVTVKIGTQTWMAENLRTTKYNDGKPIPMVTSNIDWKNLKTPGYCWYNNDSVFFRTKYGAMYNWYAISSGKLAPKGWRIPSDSDWSALENYLRANSYNYNSSKTSNDFAKSLASKVYWSSSEVVGAVGNVDYPALRNKTGFNAMPGGYRLEDGIFSNEGNIGYWWTVTNNSNTISKAWYRYIYYDESAMGRNNFLKSRGYSIRCIKN